MATLGQPVALTLLHHLFHSFSLVQGTEQFFGSAISSIIMFGIDIIRGDMRASGSGSSGGGVYVQQVRR